METFARCKEISITIAEQISNCQIVFGLYFPVTPKHKWDKRWQSSNFFTHFWVEFDSHIIDGSKEQFGEPFVSIIPADDVRYVKVGYYLLDRDTVISLKETTGPKIKWDTIDGNPLRPVKVTWAQYDDHMEVINELRKQNEYAA